MIHTAYARPGQPRAFFDNYKAAAAALVLLFISVSSVAQIDTTRPRQQINANPGYVWLGVEAARSLKPPADTLHLAVKDSGSIAWKNGRFWQWSGYTWGMLKANVVRLSDTTFLIGPDTMKTSAQGITTIDSTQWTTRNKTKLDSLALAALANAIPSLQQVTTANNKITASPQSIKGNTSNNLTIDSFNRFDVTFFNRIRLMAYSGQATTIFGPTTVTTNAADSVNIGLLTGLFSVQAPTAMYGSVKLLGLGATSTDTAGNYPLGVSKSTGQVAAMNVPWSAGGGSPVADSVKIQHGPGQNFINGKADTLVDKGLVTTSDLFEVHSQKFGPDSVVVVNPTHDSIPVPSTVLGRNPALRPGEYTIPQILGYTPENIANKNTNNGYAGLNSSGKVAPAQLDTAHTGTGLVTWQGLPSSGGAAVLTKRYDSLFMNGSYTGVRDSSVQGIVKTPVVIATSTSIRHDASTIRVLPTGVWIEAHTAFNTNSADAGSAVIEVRRSTDKGVTWSAPDTAVYNISNGVYIPSFHLRSDSTLIILYDAQPTDHTSTIKKVTLAYPYTVHTWSAPTLIYAGPLGDSSEYYAPAANRIFKCHDGVLLYPYSVNTSPGDLSSQTGTYRGAALSSFDDGSTWVHIKNLFVPSPDGLFNEPGFIQTNELGSPIYMYCRSRTGDANMIINTVNDTTFDQTEVIPMGIGIPNSNISIIYDSVTSTVIAVHNSFNPGNPTRTQIVESVSSDMLTWKPRITLDSSYKYLFFEPTLMLIKDELVALYSRSALSPLPDRTDLLITRIPKMYQQAVTPVNNVYNKIDIQGASLFTDPIYFHAGMRGFVGNNGFYIGNQTQSFNYSSTWFKTYSSLQPILWYNYVPSNTNVYNENGIWGTSTNVGSAFLLHGFQNNGTQKVGIYGDGQVTLTAPTDGDSSNHAITSGYLKRNGGASGISGTAGSIPKFATSTTIGNSTASDDGTFFTIPKANIGAGSAVSGWDLKVEGSVGTSILFRNAENNVNYITFRAEKTLAGSHNLANGQPIFNFDGQGGVAKYSMLANSELASDNYTNVDHVWSGRHDISLAETMRLTNEGTLIVNKWADVSSTILNLKWDNLANAYFNVGGVSGSSTVFAPWIRTRSINSGYGILWDINTTASNGGFVVDVNDNGSSISGSNLIFDWQNHGSSRLKLTAAGTLNLPVLPASGSTTDSIVTRDPSTGNIRVVTASRIAGIDSTTADRISRRIAHDSLASFGGTYTPTGTAGTNVTSTSSGTALYTYTRIGNIVYVSGSIIVTPTSPATFSNIRIDLPIATGATTYIFGSGSFTDGATIQPVVVGSACTNTCANLSFNSGAITIGTIEFTVSYVYVAP